MVWARDMGVSYAELLQMSQEEVMAYIEMRELEREYGPEARRGIIEGD